MRGMQRGAWLAVPLLLAALASYAAAQDLARLFPEEADVTAPGPGLVRLPLPAAVLQASAPDLSDVRLFDGAGNEVPYLVDPGVPAGAVREERLEAEARVVDLVREEIPREGAPAYTRETYRVALPRAEGDARRAWTLVFAAARPRFVREVEVRSVARDGAETVLVPRASLRRLGQRLVDDLDVVLPPFDGEEIVVTIEGEEGAFLEPTLRFASARPLASGDDLATRLPIRAQRRESGRTIVELDRPPGLVPARLAVTTTTTALDRRVTVLDVAPDGETTAIGRGRLVRATPAGGAQTVPLAESLTVDVGPARGERLRLVIDDGDSPPLADLAVTVHVAQPALLFALPGAAPDPASGVLRFGGGRAYPPRYDVAALLGDAAAVLADARRIPRATLGPVRPNPAFDAGPLLAPVMRPGATLDVDAWRWHRPITAPRSPEGLVRIRLTAADLAQAAESRADLRVVDAGGRQWPYVVAPAVARDEIALRVEGPTSRDGESRFRLVLPATPLTVDRLVIETARPVLDRPYRVVTTDDEGDERVLAEGTLAQDLRRPRPLTIALPPARVDDLELRFADGDDAPLELARVATSLPAPDLLLAAPAGAYTLLAGNPDAKAPQYELARARDVVLELKSVAARGEPGAPNPRWSGTPGGAAGRRERLARLAVWGAIVLAVLVLGALTLRVARRAPAGPGE